jgi:hypothetical protein
MESNANAKGLDRISEVVRMGLRGRVFAKVTFSDGSVCYERFCIDDPGENRYPSSLRSFNQCKGPEFNR